jgi:hypothetical protein
MTKNAITPKLNKAPIFFGDLTDYNREITKYLENFFRKIYTDLAETEDPGHTHTKSGGSAEPSDHASTHEVGGSDLVSHDNLTDFVSAEHVSHSTVEIIAGSGLSGGGAINVSRTITLDTPISVANGGTGATSFTRGAVVLGDADAGLKTMAVLADGEFIVGDGTTDPVAESGSVARDSLGLGIFDSPTFFGLAISNNATVGTGLNVGNIIDITTGDQTLTLTAPAIEYEDGGSGSSTDLTISATNDPADADIIFNPDRNVVLDATTGFEMGAATLTTTGDVTIDTDVFFIDTGNDFIGMGTASTNTTEQLHIIMNASKDILIDGTTNPRAIDTGVMRFEQTPSIDNTRCITMNIDNNNREDTHGMVINFDANNMDETASLYNVQVDTTTGNAGVVHGYEISQIGDVVEVHGLHTNPGVDPVHQNSGTFGAIEQAWKENGGFTDVTVAFGAAGTDVEMFEANGDKIYIGMAAQFDEVEVILDTDASNAGVKPTFDVSDGVGGWTSFIPTDDTRGFRDSGIIFWETNPVGWAQDTVNGVAGKYWLRITRTAVALSTPPKEDTIKVATTAEYVWDALGDLNIRNLTLGTGEAGVGPDRNTRDRNYQRDSE